MEQPTQLDLLVHDGRVLVAAMARCGGATPTRLAGLRKIGESACALGGLDGMVAIAKRIAGRGPLAAYRQAIIAHAWRGIGDGAQRWTARSALPFKRWPLRRFTAGQRRPWTRLWRLQWRRLFRRCRARFRPTLAVLESPRYIPGKLTVRRHQ